MGLTPARRATERMDARPRGDRANAARTRAHTIEADRDRFTEFGAKRIQLRGGDGVRARR